MEPLKVAVLGPLELSADDGRVPIGASKERALLSLLALRAGTAVGAATLIEGVWGDDTPRSARKLIQLYVSNLRRLLPAGSIVTVADAYRLEVDSDNVDALAFSALAAAGHRKVDVDPGAAAAILRQAIGLWRGPAVVDLVNHPLGRAEATCLEETRRVCEEDLADALLAAGEHAAAVADLEAAVQAEPLRERRSAQLMVALYRSGRQAEALRAFQRLRKHLGEEIGIEPCPELVALEEAIVLQKPELVWSARSAANDTVSVTDFPTIRSLDSQKLPHNLPGYLTAYVGRGADLAEVRSLVESSRLVTLTGAGGSGKTRLAVKVAADILDGSADAISFVDLSTVAEPEQVPAAVATALGIREDASRSALAVLIDVLRGETIVVVLDNCEHVIDACAEMAGLIGRECPRARLLATSREPLGIDGERVYWVRPLAVPPEEARTVEDLEGSDAVELFVERSRAHDYAFSLDDANAGLVASICRRLDGIPLAIELAAARTASMSLVHLNDRLDRRFRILAGGSRDAPPRQQTLQATFDWSFQLLSSPEKDALRRLSVFVGSFELEAAEAVCANGSLEVFEVADVVGSLVNKNLVVAERSSTSLRYRLLETIRQYSADKLADSEARQARAAHADFYLRLSEMAAAELIGPRQGVWLRQLDVERDNVRSTLAYLSAEPGRSEEVLRFGVALQRFFLARGYIEPIEKLRMALERADPVPADLRARAFLATGELVAVLLGRDVRGGLRSGREFGERALEMARDLDDRGLAVGALSLLCWVTAMQEEPSQAALFGEEAIELARSIGDPWLIGTALHGLAGAMPTGDDTRARSVEELDCFRTTGDRLSQCMSLTHLAVCELFGGNLEAARALLEEEIEVAEEIGSSLHLMFAWPNLGMVLVLQNELDKAAEVSRKAVTASRRRGSRAFAALPIFLLSYCATGVGDHRRAAQLAGAHDAIEAAVVETAGNRVYVWTPLMQRARDDNRAHLRRVMGDDEFERAYGIGRGLSYDEALDLALAARSD